MQWEFRRGNELLRQARHHLHIPDEAGSVSPTGGRETGDGGQRLLWTAIGPEPHLQWPQGRGVSEAGILAWPPVVPLDPAHRRHLRSAQSLVVALVLRQERSDLDNRSVAASTRNSAASSMSSHSMEARVPGSRRRSPAMDTWQMSISYAR